METIQIPKEILSAYKVFDGSEITFDEALRLVKTKKPFDMDLYSLADKVKDRFCGNKISTCEITNAKSGACPENCIFCAQSAHHSTDKPVYPLKNGKEILESAKIAKEHGADAFCIVTSGLGYLSPDDDFLAILRLAQEIIRETSLEIHCSIGILSEKTASMLKEAGVTMINHNIETAPSFFKNICTTHSIEDRIKTVKIAKSLGLKVCCGGIFGIGETERDRVEFAFTLKELDVDSIPINIHQKIPGTKAPETEISHTEALNAIAVTRIINPTKKINIAAGRNSFFADYQAMLFRCGANGMLVGNYLTIQGRGIDDDKRLLNNLMEIERK